MGKKKKSFKLIHLIIIGCICMIAIVIGVMFFNRNKPQSSDQIIANENNADGLELSLEEVKIYDRSMLIRYILKVNDRELQKLDFRNKDVAIFSIPKLEIENEIYNFSTYTPNIINRIDEKNYELFYIYDLDKLEIEEGTQFISDFFIRTYAEESYEEVR